MGISAGSSRWALMRTASMPPMVFLEVTKRPDDFKSLVEGKLEGGRKVGLSLKVSLRL